MSSVRRASIGLAVGLVLAGCAASAASEGAVPIGEVTAPAASSEAAATAPAAGGGPASPTTADPVVGAVADVLGGQASISRPVGDDGSRPEVTDDRVFILGDSITEAAGPRYYDTIRRQLIPLGWAPTIDAVKGRTTAQGLAVLEKRRRDIHDVVVILLGHNDAVDPAAYRKELDAIVDELAAVPLVVFLTSYQFEDGRGEMNDQLRVVDALHDNVELVDWNAVVSGTKGAIGPDGLHLTETGAKALAATIAVTLGVGPDGPAASSTTSTGP